MNADGTVDIVAADDTTNMVSVLLNDGSGKFAQPQPDSVAALDPGVGELRLVDVNGDGLPDILITNYKTQNISIFLSVKPKAVATVTCKPVLPRRLLGAA